MAKNRSKCEPAAGLAVVSCGRRVWLSFGCRVSDLIYQQLAQLLIERRGAYGVELARKRAVASRLLGDEAEWRHWARVRHDAEQLLVTNGGAPAESAPAAADTDVRVLAVEP